MPVSTISYSSESIELDSIGPREPRGNASVSRVIVAHQQSGDKRKRRYSRKIRRNEQKSMKTSNSFVIIHDLADIMEMIQYRNKQMIIFNFLPNGKQKPSVVVQYVFFFF
ncbi:hypothetical protein CRE_12562 [Caenorhabditis remanei]|uniref:Uncharacterized protein n=1 Tax=Caenorhabditis remanei TaxID=31234 RepID=E3M7P7_CAERE|nr:hypothetical protein CRE_12562 [Caenorhabditis remanei]